MSSGDELAGGGVVATHIQKRKKCINRPERKKKTDVRGTGRRIALVEGVVIFFCVQNMKKRARALWRCGTKELIKRSERIMRGRGARVDSLEWEEVSETRGGGAALCPFSSFRGERLCGTRETGRGLRCYADLMRGEVRGGAGGGKAERREEEGNLLVGQSSEGDKCRWRPFF